MLVMVVIEEVVLVFMLCSWLFCEQLLVESLTDFTSKTFLLSYDMVNPGENKINVMWTKNIRM